MSSFVCEEGSSGGNMLDSDEYEAAAPDFIRVEGRRQLNAAQNRTLVKSHGVFLEVESGDLRISCTGEIDGDNSSETPFDYIRHQFYRKCKLKFEQLERRRRIKNLRRVDQIQDYTDEKISAKMQSEFGPMDTFSELYMGYLKSYKNGFLHKLGCWIKKEQKLEHKNSYYKEKQDKVKETMEMLLKSYPSMKSYDNLINFQHVDWLEYPRPDFARVDVRNTSFIDKVIDEGHKVVTLLMDPHREDSDSDLTVAVLPNTKRNPLNLIFFDPMIALPSEILYDGRKISEQEALKLKSVMISYPNGVTIEEYLITYKGNYGIEPNYDAFGTFEKMCEDLDDIFLFSDEVVPGRRLLFPAYWFGLLKPMALVVTKIWHWIQFIINFNGGSIFCDEVFPKMMYFFEFEISPLDWGFESDEEFFRVIILNQNEQQYYAVHFDKEANKYKIYNTKLNEKKVDPYLVYSDKCLM